MSGLFLPLVLGVFISKCEQIETSASLIYQVESLFYPEGSRMGSVAVYSVLPVTAWGVILFAIRKPVVVPYLYSSFQ